MTTWRDVERLKDELASALEDLDREVKIGNDLMAENAKYREVLEMIKEKLVTIASFSSARIEAKWALTKIDEVLNK